MYDTNLTQAQFKKLSKIIYDVSGINISKNKENLLKARLAKRLRATKIPTVSEYVKIIHNDPEEFGRFIDGVTTNHTYFFRENKHCEFLLEVLDKKKKYQIWSAASSSGEEAYSISIQLSENKFDFEIYASDISESMLLTAQRGVYPIEKLRSVPDSIIRKYFQKGSNDSVGKVKVKKQVQEHVSYGMYNLVTGQPPKSAYDVIFCRNVMIYFDTPTKQKVVNDMYSALKPGGYFIFGQSESVIGLKTQFNTISPSIYQKPS